MFEVSVVIPSYQHGACLFNAVQSAIHAGAGEVIIVDDASTDRTHEIGIEIQHRYDRVLYLRNDFRAGAVYSRNRGINAAHFDLILPLDADDTLLAIAPLVGAVERGKWAYGGWREYGVDYAPPPPGMLHSKEVSWITMLFWKTDWQTIGGYDPDFSVGNEVWAFQRALVCAGVLPVRVEQVIFERNTDAPRTEKARQWAHVIKPMIDHKYPYPR